MELFAWEQLTTMTAVSTLTYLIVANTKELPGIKRIKTFLWSVFVSAIILCVANLAVGASYLDWKLYALCFFNGWLVAAVAGKMNDSAIVSQKEKVNMHENMS